MPPSAHDAESDLPTGEHDACVSRREFRTFRAMLEGMAEDMKRMMEMMMVSTPERGSMLDVQRKHDAEIILVRAELATLKAAQAQSSPLPRRIWETAVITAVQVITALAMAMFAKGFVVSLMAEALKSVGGTK